MKGFGSSSGAKNVFASGNSGTRSNPFASNKDAGGPNAPKPSESGSNKINPFSSSQNSSAVGASKNPNPFGQGGQRAGEKSNPFGSKPGNKPEEKSSTAAFGGGNASNSNPFSQKKNEQENKENKKEQGKEEDKNESKEDKKEENKDARSAFGAKPSSTNVFAKKNDTATINQMHLDQRMERRNHQQMYLENKDDNKDDKKEDKKEDKKDGKSTSEVKGIEKSELSSAAKSKLDSRTLDSIIHEWNDKLISQSDAFKKQADQLRNEELAFRELFEQNSKIRETASKIVTEYQQAEVALDEISVEQDKILKTLDEFEERLDEYSRRSHIEDTYNIRKQISEKSLNVNTMLSKMDVIIKDTAKKLPGYENSEGTEGEYNNNSTTKGVINIVNNQYDMLKWMEETIDNMYTEFEIIDSQLDRKLPLKY